MKRALGWAAGVSESGVQSLPFQSVRCSGGAERPSHQMSPSSVRATLVKMRVGLAGPHGVRVGVVAGAGGHAEEPGLGVDGVEPAVVAELHPGDVVADRLDLPAREGRDHHRHVRLAAGRREGGGDVGLLALGAGDAEDEHVLGHPAVVASHGRRDAQREALLAEQGVAAVAGAVAPDLTGLGEVGDVLVLGVAGPRHVGPGGAVLEHERVADGVQAGHEVAVVAQHVEHRLAHAGHDPHVDGHVRRVGQLDADVGDRAPERTHREGHHVHGAALHGAGVEPEQLLLHLRGRPPVVGRTGVLLALGADEGAVLDPGDVAGVGLREEAVGALGLGQLGEGAAVDEELA